jgi:hypothetical protein
MEHKTATSADGTYFERLQGDLQILLYTAYLERELGIRIEGVLYNVLLKCNLKMKTGEGRDRGRIRSKESRSYRQKQKREIFSKTTDARNPGGIPISV